MTDDNSRKSQPVRARMTGRRLPWLLATLVLAAVVPASPGQANAAEKIDLELFSREEIGTSGTCSVRLWQANRDPETDRYAVVFQEELDTDHRRSPARIMIAGKAERLERAATGGASAGYDLYPDQFYRSPDGKTRVLLELRIAPEEGEAVEIESGLLTVIQSGRLPFRMRVKGGAGCMTPGALGGGEEPDGDLSNIFHRYELDSGNIPDVLIAAANEAYECDWREALDRAGAVAYQTSEEGAVWDLGCAAGMHNVAHVYAHVYLADPTQFTLLRFQNVKGHPRQSRHVLFNPAWDETTRTVTGFTVDRGLGDCGKFERHRLVDAEFKMIEYRAKPDCDGNAIDPEDFPLIYKGQ
ncbi:DUF1176 domain-containing protein [Stappia sp.]|uniref:DUF1176 domain-containing protein n=1 Tax=Stappia sp. TaxID=1870903 RepID=UPI003A99A8D6